MEDTLDRKLDTVGNHLHPYLDTLHRWLDPYPGAYTGVMLLGLLLAAWIANWVTKRILIRGLRKLIVRLIPGEGGGHNHALKLTVIPRLANVVPALVVSGGVTLLPELSPKVVAVVQALCQAFIVVTIALSISRLLDLINTAYERKPEARNKPIKGYLQVAKIIMFVLVAISVVATLVGAQFLHILTGLGAMTAVLMLIFQDTILSLVASVQISSDGRVRIGDWIEMPSLGVDGDVIDIALHTVTVKNFDNTVTTIPTKKLISESFKNWRQMRESGGRRIKRSILIDEHSVRFLDEAEIRRAYRFSLLDQYLAEKHKEISSWNDKLGSEADAVNRRRVTNLGTFRAYTLRYLQNNPHVRKDMTLIVRQLQSTPDGLPLEIYCFANSVVWSEYENIQSDIFDHLFAILPEFGLRVFQSSSDAPLTVRLEREQSSPVSASQSSA